MSQIIAVDVTKEKSFFVSVVRSIAARLWKFGCCFFSLRLCWSLCSHLHGLHANSTPHSFIYYYLFACIQWITYQSKSKQKAVLLFAHRSNTKNTKQMYIKHFGIDFDLVTFPERFIFHSFLGFLFGFRFSLLPFISTHCLSISFSLRLFVCIHFQLLLCVRVCRSLLLLIVSFHLGYSKFHW